MTDPTTWVIVRIHLFDRQDVATVHILQDQMEFVPITEYLESVEDK